MIRILGNPRIAATLVTLSVVCLVGATAGAAGNVVSHYGMSLQYLEGGSFERGGAYACTSGKAPNDCKASLIYDEEPRHSVRVDDFYLCRTEVTQLQWAKVMGEAIPAQAMQALPKTDISWEDAQAFLSRLSGLTGRTFRLPSEAEWEYATASHRPQTLDDYAWYRNNATKQAHPVAKLKPNPRGLYDMLGNVWEWTADWYSEDYYRVTAAENPPGPSEGLRKVVRGGAYNSVASYVRHGVRMAFAPNTKSPFTGFRCAMSAD